MLYEWIRARIARRPAVCATAKSRSTIVSWNPIPRSRVSLFIFFFSITLIIQLSIKVGSDSYVSSAQAHNVDPTRKSFSGVGVHPWRVQGEWFFFSYTHKSMYNRRVRTICFTTRTRVLDGFYFFLFLHIPTFLFRPVSKRLARLEYACVHRRDATRVYTIITRLTEVCLKFFLFFFVHSAPDNTTFYQRRPNNVEKPEGLCTIHDSWKQITFIVSLRASKQCE